VLKTETGTAFAKGLRVNDHGNSTQLREAAAAPLVERFSPGLLARVSEGGWDINIFAHVGGRHADHAPGSGDLSAVADVMRGLGSVPCPELPIFKRAEQRWRSYYDQPAAAGALAGTTMLHTDWNPFNVLIAPVGARVVDWAWATLGAPWVDPACWAPTHRSWTQPRERRALGGERSGMARGVRGRHRRLRAGERAAVE
jgi:hypothetical protein